MNAAFRKMLSAKIHRATVTAADVDYEGSFTLPPHLLRAAGIEAYESIEVWNVTRGSRLQTYAIRGEPGSSDVCANGAAAHLIHPGDRVILASFAYIPEDAIATHRPRLVFVDEQNRIVHQGPEIAGPQRRSPSAAADPEPVPPAAADPAAVSPEADRDESRLVTKDE